MQSQRDRKREYDMILINQLKFPIDWDKRYQTILDMVPTQKQVLGKVSKVLKIAPEQIKEVSILKHSLDARKKPDIFQVCTIGCKLHQKEKEEQLVKRLANPNIQYQEMKAFQFQCHGTETLMERPVIIGAGPAGLFCAYMLAKHGYKPLVLERGCDVDKRSKDVDRFWEHGKLCPNSNVQFGEGGAGTFSDGKLNTLIKDKDGRNKEVLKVFVECGASEEILYSAKPHIGTDVLKEVVKNLRNKIIDFGGEVRFEAFVSEFKTDNGVIKGVVVNDREYIPCSVCVLAIGHSARDTFGRLHEIQIRMEARAFAIVVRVEHPQGMINERMYGEHGKDLPAAAYKLTAKTTSGRGVYSFCMCPGGYVVNASSEPGRLAVNGMSYSKRDSKNANSAIIVTVNPEDFLGEGPLSGVNFQRHLEELAFQRCQGKIPVQYYYDYKNNQKSVENPDLLPCLKGLYQFDSLRGILPEELEEAFMEGMEHFDRVIPGYTKYAILDGLESRTSSPLRIVRDEHLVSTNLLGLYPCGEGAGYAGGITSAAMDGILVAQEIANKYKAFYE